MKSASRRSESEILTDLELLCKSKGFAHAIAYFCFRDNFIGYSDTIKSTDFTKMHSENRLIRTEISTLIGFMMKGNIDLSIPKPGEIQKYIETAERLLNELHDAMNMEFFSIIGKDGFDHKKDNPFKNARLLREAIFYAAESAYSFQYSQLAVRKYADDNIWLQDNKGFAIEQAAQVIEAIVKIQQKNFTKLRLEMIKTHPDEWTLLPAFIFNIDDVTKKSKLDMMIVQSVLKAFSTRDFPANNGFKEIGDFNLINASPFIYIGNEQYIGFQYYNMVEALYESPFYWLYGDKTYQPIAMKNRGDFTEEFSTEKLESIFGKSRVIKNLRIVDKTGEEVGEIDTLVVYADRAVILQAKSKKLTVPARKGNDNALRKDFQDAIQSAYDQGWKCANFLLEEQYKAIDPTGKNVNIRHDFREIFIFCIVSDHYPGLSFQARQFLQHQEHDIIRPPHVMDLFYLDVVSEFLVTPLYFFSFANKRTQYFEKVHSSNELIVLAYHLSYNLWFDKENDFINLGDDISQSLDAAMCVRRLGLPGARTPEGILTKFKGKPFGRLIDFVSSNEQDKVLDLGYYLLELNEETALGLGQAIEEMATRTKSDGKHHDITIATGDMGLTVHCSYASPDKMLTKLVNHCRIRKYSQKARIWFGIGRYAPYTEPFQIATGLEYPWEYSESTENELKKYGEIPATVNSFTEIVEKLKKPRRNAPCTCGSQIKSKKCCYK